MRRPILTLAVVLAIATGAYGVRRAFHSSAPASQAAQQMPACRPIESVLAIPAPKQEMVPICQDVYVEHGMSPEETKDLRQAHDAARKNLTQALGQSPRAAPLILFCRSAECKVTFGISPSVAAANDLGFARDGVPTRSEFLQRSSVVVTGPVEGSARILTHELVHAEMKTWVAYDSSPTWFNEGMATFVANEPSCNRQVPSDIFDVTQLRTKQKWERHIASGKALETYCAARREVATWAAQFGDEKARAGAFRRLMESLSKGMSFEEAYSLR